MLPSPFQPAQSEVERLACVAFLRHAGRALVESHHDVGADLALEELGETLASSAAVESEYERRELTQAIDGFLRTLSADDRNIFICRYWLFAPTADIAARLGFSQSKVTTSLYRTRQKLRTYLEKEELI